MRKQCQLNSINDLYQKFNRNQKIIEFLILSIKNKYAEDGIRFSEHKYMLDKKRSMASNILKNV
jgi:hypothetical protein